MNKEKAREREKPDKATQGLILVCLPIFPGNGRRSRTEGGRVIKHGRQMKAGLLTVMPQSSPLQLSKAVAHAGKGNHANVQQAVKHGLRIWPNPVLPKLLSPKERRGSTGGCEGGRRGGRRARVSQRPPPDLSLLSSALISWASTDACHSDTCVHV